MDCRWREEFECAGAPAAKRRKNAAHGASRGKKEKLRTSPEGAKETCAASSMSRRGYFDASFVWIYASRARIAFFHRSRAFVPRSIPNVTRIILNPILLQKRDVLLLKSDALMMLLLRRDVLRHGRNARFANTEHSISRLPRKSRTMLLPHPPRRIRLNHAHNLRRRMNRPHPHQQVNVIRHSIHNQSRTTHLPHNPAKISKQLMAKFLFDQRPPSQSRENHMQ